MRALVTTLGRSHFIQVATSLVRAGVDVTLHQGWVVKDPEHSFWLKVAAEIVGRQSLIYGFTKRMTPELEGRVVSDFPSEFIDTFGKMVLGKMGRYWWNVGVKMGFWFHGFRTRKLLRKRHYDVFHVKSGLGAGGAIKAAHKAGVKVLADHSAGAPQFIIEHVYNKKWGPWTYWWWVMQDCLKADLLMVDCDWVKHTFQMYGFPEDKMRVVYMGLDERFNGMKKWSEDLSGIGLTPDKPLRVVFTGGFAYHKGNEYFLAAVEKLLESNRYFSFRTIGDRSISPEQEKRYPRAIKAIEFLGHLPQDEMCRQMVDSQIYLFPSLSEGCAKSAYEALSMGLCVVCTQETGMPFKDGESGYIIGTRDADSIAEKLLWLVDDPGQIRAAGLAGTALMRQHTWTKYADDVKAVYEELMNMETK